MSSGEIGQRPLHVGAPHATGVQSDIENEKVQSCGDCGSVSIHLGPVSVRLDAEALRSVWITLGEAVEHLERERSTPFTGALAGIPRGNA